MLPAFIYLTLLISPLAAEVDYAAIQVETYAENHSNESCIITTSYGVPINTEMATTALNWDLLRHRYFLDMAQRFVRERTPVRVVHAKATGAFGYLEITNDISSYCRAKIFSVVGNKIPVAVRISSGLTEKGGADTVRDVRGLAVKLYTEEGNMDIVCTNAPVYAYKDPLLFPSFIHVTQRNPATGLRDWNMIWDFVVKNPESFFFFLVILTDLGIPDGFQHMSAHNIHTMQVVNREGVSHFMRFHFLPDGGIKNLTATEAAEIVGKDPDYAIRSLYNVIERREYPSWTLYAQILSLAQVKTARFDPFDVTNILPEKDYPLRKIGKLVLNKNPVNQFAQIEQLAFNPGNLLDGFVGGLGGLFKLRDFIYRDGNIHRLGSNFNNIAVNRPLNKAHTYNRDGAGPLGDNGADAPNYSPNSFGGCVPVDSRLPNPKLLDIIEKLEPENFGQAGEYFKEMSADDRERTIENTVSTLTDVVPTLQKEVITLLAKISSELSEGVAAGLEA